MSNDFIPRRDAHALIYYTTLANAMAADPQSLGVGADVVAALQAEVAQFAASLQQVDRMQKDCAAEVARKKGLRSGVDGTVRGLLRQVHANPNVAASAKAAAGIPVHDGVRSRLSPLVPTHLVVTADVTGANHLTWKTEDPSRSTMYRIEARSGAETEFRPLDVVAAPPYVHEGQKPGAPIVYRVLARRSKKLSAPSNEAGIYADSEE